MANEERMVLTGKVGDAGDQDVKQETGPGIDRLGTGPATGVRLNDLGQVDVAMEIGGERTQLTQGLDSIYDLLERGLAETRRRLVQLQEDIELLVVDAGAEESARLQAQPHVLERPVPPPDDSGWSCCGYGTVPQDERSNLTDAILDLAQTMQDRTGKSVGWNCPIPFAVALADLISSRIPPLNAINAAIGRHRQMP